MAANQMKLKTLQQTDPYIVQILGSADQVAMYTFDSSKNVWSKTDTEGGFFIYKRTAAPFYGFIVLNRLELRNPTEAITANLDFHHQGDFLLYRHLDSNREGSKSKSICGIWFFEEGKCNEIKDLLISLVDEVKRAAGSRGGATASSAGSTRAPVQAAKTEAPGGSGGQAGKAGGEGTNILKILSKAHTEFCQTQGAGTAQQVQGDARSRGDNSRSPRRQGEGSTLYKPTPLKAGHDAPREEKVEPPAPVPHGGSLSVEELFQTARQQDSAGDRPELPDVTKPSLLTRSTSVPDPASGHDLIMKLFHMKSVTEVEALQIDPARQQGSAPDRDISKLFSQAAATRKVSQAQQAQQPPLAQPQPQQTWPQPQPPQPLLQEPPRPPQQQQQHRPPQQQHTLQPQYPEQGWKVTPLQPEPRYDSGEPMPSFPSTDLSLEPEDEALPRPEDFLSSAGPTRTPLMQDKLQVSGSAAETPDVLLSPLAFLGGPGSVSSHGPMSSMQAAAQPAAAVESDPEFSPLTKTQLQQAMIYLIKNSPDFMDQVHTAYLKSVEQAMKGRKS